MKDKGFCAMNQVRSFLIFIVSVKRQAGQGCIHPSFFAKIISGLAQVCFIVGGDIENLPSFYSAS